MSNLQTVAFGAASDGSQGDSTRAAFTKDNANVAILNAQATLTSFATTITTASALTAASHLGKRVNVNLASPGTINLPTAASCGADGVILIRNLGATLVTLAITASSGDTVALTALGAGESALMDTDGIHTWNCALRARSSSANETVLGNSTVLGNEAVTGTLGVTGASTLSSLTVTGASTLSSLTSSGSTLNGSTVLGTGAARFTVSSDANNAYLVAAGAALLGSVGAASPTVLLTNNTERARYDTAGHYLMGQTVYNAAQVNGGSAWPGVTLNTTGQLFSQCAADANVYLSKASGQNGTFLAFCYGGFQIGGVTVFNASTVSYNTTSDYRLKTTLKPVDDALERVCAIPTYRGYFNADGPESEQDIALAHEIQAQVPAAVTGDKDAVEYHPIYRDGYDPCNVLPVDIAGVKESIVAQQVDYSKLVVPMLAAVQQLNGEIVAALARIAALEAKFPA